jgi:hypothetical protein
MANTLNLYRNGASLLANAFGVGFIDWLDVTTFFYRTCDAAPSITAATSFGLET